MTPDLYSGAGPRWASGASLVYGPIAEELVEMSPCRLAGRVVADVGAGTGVATAALLRRGARLIAADLSHGMLSWDASGRPPAVVSDACALPLATSCVDAVVAAFVLNHLFDPAPGFAEASRVLKPGGVILACVYSAANRSAPRDRIDEVAVAEGWQVPNWYVDIKANAVPVLGSAPRMEAAARAARLTDVRVDERPVDVGVTSPPDLVDYRLGQAHFTAWLASIGGDRASEVRARAIEAVRPVMEPYRPGVVFLSARTPLQGSRKPSSAP